MQFLKKKICLGIFMNDDRISDDFNVVVSSFKRLRSGTENARLPRLGLNLFLAYQIAEEYLLSLGFML